MNKDKFGYMSNSQRKQLQNDFVQSANHQIELLRQMEHAQSNAVTQRSQESIQTSEHHGKWDELAYQNKLRGLFGAKKLKAPVKPKLRHKKAVNEFLADVKQEDTSTHQAKEQDSNDQMKQNFMDLIQEETSQFNQLMESKKQSLEPNRENANFLDDVKQKFAELKSRVSQFNGVKDAIPNQDALVQITANGAKIMHPKEEMPVAIAAKEEMPDESTMLGRVSKLFHDAQ